MNCDVWCVGFLHQEAVDWFQKSPDWKPLFYGARAVVFGKSDLYFEPTSPLGGKELDDIRILGRSLHVLSFAININDWDGAIRLYNGANKNFPNHLAVADAKRALRGLFSYHSRDYESAAIFTKTPKEGALFTSNGILLNSYLHLTIDHWKKDRFNEAFAYSQAAVLLAKNDMLAHYNYGVIGAYLEASGKPVKVAEGVPGWRQSLEFFIKNFDEIKGLPQQSIGIARNLLGSSIQPKPALLEPQRPSEETVETFQNYLNALD